MEQWLASQQGIFWLKPGSFKLLCVEFVPVLVSSQSTVTLVTCPGCSAPFHFDSWDRLVPTLAYNLDKCLKKKEKKNKHTKKTPTSPLVVFFNWEKKSLIIWYKTWNLSMDSTWCVELSLYLCFQSGAKLLEYPFSRTCWSNRPQFIWDDRLMHLCSTDEKKQTGNELSGHKLPRGIGWQFTYVD